MAIKCCKECHEQGNSYLGCHSKCEKYLKEKDEHERLKTIKQQQDVIDNINHNLYKMRTSHKNKPITNGRCHKR